MIKFLVLPVFAYLLGSIPWGIVFWGIVLTRLFTSVDIRREGSGNIGATNVGRIAGPTLGVLTLVGDMLKGAIPVWIAGLLITPNSLWGEIYISVVSLAAVCGVKFTFQLCHLRLFQVTFIRFTWGLKKEAKGSQLLQGALL